LQDQNQLLRKLNNQAKVRCSTKLTMLIRGEGKVMSFEDIIIARAARDKKQAIKDNKKRSRKHNNTKLKADEEVEPEVTPALNKRGRKRKRTIQEPELELEPESDIAWMLRVPWRVLVTRIL
jgi:hypothetical protein